MLTFISVLIIIVCILLSLVVLIQNPKGGGLASGFSAANQIGGVRKTADFLEKATWTLAIALVVLSMVSVSLTTSGPEVEGTDEFRDAIENVQQPAVPETSSDLPEGIPQEESSDNPQE